MNPTLIHTQSGLSELKLFFALSLTPHGLLGNLLYSVEKRLAKLSYKRANGDPGALQQHQLLSDNLARGIHYHRLHMTEERRT